jgi:hypothetical protein
MFTYKARSQALGYTLKFSLFSLKINIFPFSASILTFFTQKFILQAVKIQYGQCMDE